MILKHPLAMMRNLKSLPPGLWFTFHPPGETTAEDLQKALHEAGIEIPLECISLRPPTGNDPKFTKASAIVVIRQSTLVPILNWMLEGRTLHGHAIRAYVPKKSRSPLEDAQMNFTYYADLHPEENHGGN